METKTAVKAEFVKNIGRDIAYTCSLLEEGKDYLRVCKRATGILRQNMLSDSQKARLLRVRAIANFRLGQFQWAVTDADEYFKLRKSIADDYLCWVSVLSHLHLALRNSTLLQGQNVNPDLRVSLSVFAQRFSAFVQRVSL